MSKRSITPLPWLLFSAGGVMAAMFLPVLLVLFAFSFPFDWISPPSYDDLHGLLSNPLTLLVLFGVFTLCLFHWAHRFRYTLYDGLQIKHLGGVVALLCYGGAVVGSLAAAYLLARVP